MITVKVTTKLTPLLSSFSDKVWGTADSQHYGKKIIWTKESKFIHAYNDKQLIGLLELTIEVGVMHIIDLVVDFGHQKQGIGTTLMKQAELLAKKNTVHKIYLETGKDWSARTFYEKLGYTKTGDLPRHFAQKDFVYYTKFIDL